MYHLVGDCNNTQNTTKTHLLEGFVSNAISNKRREMTALKKRIWVIESAQEAAHRAKKQRT